MLKQLIQILLSFSLLSLFMFSCSNYDTSKENDKIPPGAASIIGEVSSIENVQNGSIYELVVKKINQLGPGSPMIALGEKITVRIPKSFSDKISSENVEVGDKLNMVIKSLEAAGNIRYWQILNFN